MSKQTAVWTKIKKTFVGLKLPHFLNVHHKTKSAHKKLYKKHEWYRLWTDTKFSSGYHKTLLISVSLIILLLIVLQLLSLSAIKEITPKAEAGSYSVTWTTQEDFENNDVTIDTPTSNNYEIDTTSIPGSIVLGSESTGPTMTRKTVAAGDGHTVAIKTDGTVLSTGKNDFGQVNTSAWSSIVEVAAGANHTVGLTSTGTVIGVGSNSSGQLNVGGWQNIKSLSASNNTTVGITENDTVVVAGEFTGDVSGMTQIKKIATCYDPMFVTSEIIGLRYDGTVVAAGPNNYGQLNTGSWQGIKDVACAAFISFGVTSSNTIITAGSDPFGVFPELPSWVQIKNITADNFHIIGLKEDNTAISEGSEISSTGILNVSGWTNIDYLDSSSNQEAIGLRSNGTLVGSGMNTSGQLDFSSWSDIRLSQAPSLTYATEGSLSKLIIDAGEGKPLWNSINWDATIPDGTAVIMTTRGSDDNISWPTNWDGPDGLGSDSYHNFPGLIKTPPTRYLEIAVMLFSQGTSTPVLNSITVNYNTIDPPTNLAQFKDIGQQESLGTSAWVNASNEVYLSAEVACLSDNACHAEVELKKEANDFNGQDLLSGSVISPGGSGSSIIGSPVSLVEPGGYKWRTRNVDDAGRVTPWVEFNNGDTAFRVDNTGPIGTFKIENGMKATNGLDVHLSVETSDNVGGSGLHEFPVRFSNNNTDWSDWQSVASYSLWKLTEGAGEKVVYMQIRDNAGNVTTVNSSIVLDNVPPQIIYDQNNVYPADGWNVKENINSLEIRVATDKPAIVYVDYGLNEPNEEAGGSTIYTTSHDILIRQLNANTTYKYRIRAVDQLNNMITYPANADTNNQYFTASTGRTDTGFDGDPLASDLSQVEITASTAKITWKTLLPTTSWVDFGLENTYGNTAGSHLLETTHVVELKNLVAGSTYHYRVRGNDAIDNEYASSDYVFKAVMKPVILAHKIDQITPTTAEISWVTNVRTTGTLSYGLNGSFTGVQKSDTASTTHVVKLAGLLDGMAYKYQITALDEYGEVATSAVTSLDTPIDMTGPTIKNVRIDLLPLTQEDETAQAVVTWETDKPATTQVFYDVGTIGNTYGSFSIENASLDTTHTVILKNLTPATSYRFKLVSKDKRNIVTESPGYTAATPQSQKTILQLIVKVLEETFSWVGGIRGFWSEFMNGGN